MTPKEKAKELVDKFYIFNHIGNKHAIKCALIAVDEILDPFRKVLPSSRNYWQEVKQEIENYGNS